MEDKEKYTVEEYLLCSLIINPDAIPLAHGILGSLEVFRDERNRHLYEAMLQLHDKVGAFKFHELVDFLESKNLLPKVGGIRRVTDISIIHPDPTAYKSYAKALRSALLTDRARDILSDALSKIESGESVEEVLASADENIETLLKDAPTSSIEEISASVGEAIEMYEEIANSSRLVGMPTGYRDLDELTYGLSKGDLIILGGRPSMGKTAFGLNIARNVAIAGYNVGIISIEMTDVQLASRFITIEAGISSGKFRKGILDEQEVQKMVQASSRVAAYPIWIDDSTGNKYSNVKRVIKLGVARHNWELVVVDYMQLIQYDLATLNRWEAVGMISSGLKELAKSLGIAIVLISQLNRATESRTNKIPTLADLRESGNLEQDADLVLFVYRESYYSGDKNDKSAKIIVAKHRNGPTGDVDMYFDLDSNRFYDRFSVPPNVKSPTVGF